MSKPGFETPEELALYAKADEIVRDYAAKNQIPQFDKDFKSSSGGVPVVLVLAALIKDREYLRMMLNQLLETVK
jgi:hypothetical protein